ncbi:hypothetical protein KR059_003160, partial [Drosophila kikkawai]
CQHNTKYVEGFNLSMAENRIYCAMRTRIKIPADVKFYISLERGLSRAGPYNTFFKYDIDFCKVISFRNNLFKRWILNLDKHGHMPKSCPWQVDEYYLKDWQLSKDVIPPFVVAGLYRSKIIIYLGSLGSDSYEILIECEVISQLM